MLQKNNQCQKNLKQQKKIIGSNEPAKAKKSPTKKKNWFLVLKIKIDFKRKLILTSYKNKF